jgi:hypothetical protein
MTYSYPMETSWAGDIEPDVGVRTLSSIFDRTFRNICSAGWANESDGNVEAPCGYFFIVEIPEKGGELDELITACEVGREYDDGTFRSRSGAESAARHEYNERVQTFSAWDTEPLQPWETDL